MLKLWQLMMVILGFLILRVTLVCISASCCKQYMKRYYYKFKRSPNLIHFILQTSTVSTCVKMFPFFELDVFWHEEIQNILDITCFTTFTKDLLSTLYRRWNLDSAYFILFAFETFENFEIQNLVKCKQLTNLWK